MFVQVGLTPQRSNQAESDQDGLGMTDSSVSFSPPPRNPHTGAYMFSGARNNRRSSRAGKGRRRRAVPHGALGGGCEISYEPGRRAYHRDRVCPSIHPSVHLATHHSYQIARAARAAARSCSSRKCSATRTHGSRSGTASTSRSEQSRSRRLGTMLKRLEMASFRGKNWYNFRFCLRLDEPVYQ